MARVAPWGLHYKKIGEGCLCLCSFIRGRAFFPLRRGLGRLLLRRLVESGFEQEVLRNAESAPGCFCCNLVIHKGKTFFRDFSQKDLPCPADKLIRVYT